MQEGSFVELGEIARRGRASGLRTLLLDDDAIFALRPGMVVELPGGELCTVVSPPVSSVLVHDSQGRPLRVDARAGAHLIERVRDAGGPEGSHRWFAELFETPVIY